MLRIARFAFAAWLLVEILSWAGILPLTLEFTWLGLVLTASLAWLALEVISWRLRKVGAGNLWGWTFLAALISQCTDALGDILRLYGTQAWYDQAAHFVGGAVVALVFYNIFHNLQGHGSMRLPPSWMSAFSIFSAMAIGSLYELEEYGEDVLFHSNRLGSAFDTGNDMFFNTIGAVVLVVCLVYFRRKRV
ncbi:MAG: DUF2238 domain-containing protein [Patescibacteria group bacterium]